MKQKRCWTLLSARVALTEKIIEFSREAGLQRKGLHPFFGCAREMAIEFFTQFCDQWR